MIIIITAEEEEEEYHNGGRIQAMLSVTVLGGTMTLLHGRTG